MSLLPLLLDELIDRPRVRVGDVYDQHFGLGLLNDNLVNPSRLLIAPLRSGYVRPWRNLAARESGVSNVKVDQSGFNVSLDVQQFKPEELNVKVVDDYLVVEGKHEERSDEHGFVSRQFARRYKIPEGVKAEELTSKLSSDGVLMLHAPVKQTQPTQGRVIPITQTNTPAVQEKKKTPEEEKMEAN